MYSNCALTFNGVNLDKYLKGYMTVNVEGRQLIAPRAEYITIPGKDGDYYLSKTYPPREIKVHFLLQTKRNYDFLEIIKRLNQVLQTKKEVEFFFRDEEGVRFGQVIASEDPPYDSNTGIGTFTIHASSPFIYSTIRETEGKVPLLKYRKYPVKLVEINIICDDAKKIVVTNISNGQKIILNGDFAKDDKLKITDHEITLNGRNILNYLDFVESDYHEFVIYSEDEIRISSGKLKVLYRERAL